MFKPELAVSIDGFGLKWLENGKYKITKQHKFVDDMTKDMRANGISAMELSTSACWNLEEERESFPAVKEYVKIIKNNGVKLNSVHLPAHLPFWDFGSLKEERRKLSVERAKWAISHFEEGEPNYFIFHPGITTSQDLSVREQMHEALAKSMEEICDSVSATICIENMPREELVNKASEAVWLLKRVPKLMMVVDVNHPLRDTPEDFIEMVGDRVKCLHISDRDSEGEKHWLPGKGILNWNKIIGALEKVKYQGKFTYEVAIQRDNVSISQIKENYEKLFSEYNK